MKWTVLWSKGPHDNPIDGQFEVEARDFTEACEFATTLRGVDFADVDAVIRTDILNDL